MWSRVPESAGKALRCSGRSYSAAAWLNRCLAWKKCAAAPARRITVVSTVDAHAEDDPEFASWPPHCIAGTMGQHKPAATLLDRKVVVPNRDEPFSLEGVQQIIAEKQTLDSFAARNVRTI